MKIFISYQYETHQALASQLGKAFQKVKITPQCVNLELAFGKDIGEKIGEVLRGYDYVIVLLTKSYVESEWMEAELTAFLHHELNSKTNIILPVLVEDCKIHSFLKDRIIDIRGKSFEEAFGLLVSRISPSKHVFVIMKYEDKMLDYAYEMAIKPVIEEFYYTPVRMDKIQAGGMVTDQILKHIERSEIVLADLTGERPNCYYEAGYADASGKEIIFTIKKDCKIHFDVAVNRFICWESEAELENKLRERFKYIKEKNSLKNYKTPFI